MPEDSLAEYRDAFPEPHPYALPDRHFQDQPRPRAALAAMVTRLDRSVGQVRECAGRLDTLSPLAVLGRGYAVAWNDDRTRVLRTASDVRAGDRIRVTLSRGELACDVRGTE